MVKALRSCLEAAKGKIKAGWNLRQASKLCNVPRKSCSLGYDVGSKALRAETRISTIPSSHATDRDPLRGRDPLRHLQYLDATNEWALCRMYASLPLTPPLPGVDDYEEQESVSRGSRGFGWDLLCTVSFSLAAAQQSKLRIVQTNNAGDSLSIIDPATNKVVAEI